MTPERLQVIRDSVVDRFPNWSMTGELLIEYDRMAEALQAIEAHHEALNHVRGRPLSRSTTIRLAREGLGKEGLV